MTITKVNYPAILAAKMGHKEIIIKVWAGTQTVKPIPSAHPHWPGPSVEIIAGALKMQVVILPAEPLHRLFILDSLIQWGGREDVLTGNGKEVLGTLRKGACPRGRWTVVVCKVSHALKEGPWGLVFNRTVFLPFQRNPESLLRTSGI